MTMSVGLARIINDPDASVLTRKALGALSNPVLVVTDKGVTINDDGLIALKLKPGGGLTEDATGLSAAAQSSCFTETVCIQVSTNGVATPRIIRGDPWVPVHDAHLLLEHNEYNFARLTISDVGYLTIDASGSGGEFPEPGWSSGGINLYTGPYHGVRINGSAAIYQIYVATAHRSFLTNGSAQFYNFTWVGVRREDTAIVTPTESPGMGITGWSACISDTDVVQIRVTTANIGGAGATSGLIIWRVMVISFKSR